MLPFVDLLLWINLITILLYIPVLCYLDVRYREVNPILWAPMVCICGFITALFYFDGTYPWYSLVVSLVMCLIFHLVFRSGYIEGADYLFLCGISLFWVMTPVNGYAHGLMQLLFYPYLIAAMTATALIIFAYNLIKGSRLGIIAMMSYYPGGVPFMLPISAAFIMSVVMG